MGFIKSFFSKEELSKEINNTNTPSSANLKVLAEQSGFVCYRGEDILELPNIQPLVIQLREAFGGDDATFAKHIYPSVRVLAAYCQYLPASEDKHHSEYLGLIIHSLQSAIVAMNYLRNCNVNFGVDPDKRNEHTLAYKLACTLAALLHDVGKINDWVITTQVKKSSFDFTVEHRYSFIRSIPEFIAKAHNVKLDEVYGDVNNDSKSLYLPKYQIVGARKGRSKKHEILGNEKKGLFISPATEELIANASYQLYEDLHFFMYEKLIDQELLSVSSLIGKVVQIADAESAKFWTETHKDDLGLKQSSSSRFTAEIESPEVEINVRKPYKEKVKQQEEIKEETQQSENGDLENNFEDVFSDEPVFEAKDNQNENELVEKETEIPVIDNTTDPMSEVSSGFTFNQEDKKKKEPSAKLEITPAQIYKSSSNANIPDAFKDHVKKAFGAILNEMLQDIVNLPILINADSQKGLLFSQGTVLGDDMFKIRNGLKIFLRVDSSSLSFFKHLFDKVSEKVEEDITYKVQCEGDFLTKAIHVLCAYDIIVNIKSPIFKICPDAFWTEKHSILHYLDAVLISSPELIISDKSSLFNLETVKEFGFHNILFEDVNALPFFESLDRLAQTRISKQHISREHAISGSLSGKTIIKEGDSIPAQAIDDNKDNKEVISSVFLDSRNDTNKIEQEMEDVDFALIGSVFKDGKRSAIKNDVKNLARGRSFTDDPERDEIKRRVTSINVFADDEADEIKIENLKLKQHFFYFTDEELLKLQELSDEEKDKRLQELTTEINAKIKTTSFKKDFWGQIAKAIRIESNYIDLKEIGKGNYYASFVWSITNQKKSGGEGVSFLNNLLVSDLIALSQNGERDEIKDELDFFSCVMLSPQITEYLILSGLTKGFRVIIKDWHDLEKKATTAKQMLRYFAHLVIQCQEGQKVFGENVYGNPIKGLRIKYNALKECSMQLKAQGYESQRYHLLNLSNQSNPPYVWKQKGNIIVSFFKKDDLENNILPKIPK